MITGSVCQACLTDFWTSGRLHQHLAYAPRDGSANRCFAILKQMNLPLQRERASMPSSVEGFNRREAQRVFGPHRAFQSTTERELEDARQHLGMLQLLQLQAGLTAISQEWCDTFVEHGHSQSGLQDLPSMWLARLAEEPEALHQWSEGVFLHWGRCNLEEFIESLIDGYAEPIISDAFADAEDDLPKAQLLRDLRHAKRRVENLEAQEREDAQPRPHRPVQRGSANVTERLQTQHEIPRRIAQQHDWQERI